MEEEKEYPKYFRIINGLMFVREFITVEDNSDPRLCDGEYLSYSRLVKKLSDVLYLDIFINEKFLDLKCNKCDKQINLFYPFGITSKYLTCERKRADLILICVDCLETVGDKELAQFIMEYKKEDFVDCRKCPKKMNPKQCLTEKGWLERISILEKEMTAFFEQRDGKKKK